MIEIGASDGFNKQWGQSPPGPMRRTIDRLVPHAEIVNLKGDSYRLKGRDLGKCQVTAQCLNLAA